MGWFSKTWFSELVGFKEDYDSVRQNLFVDGEYLESRSNDLRLRFGSLETPSLAELRASTAGILAEQRSPLQVKEVIANVQKLHQDPKHNGALFQVASQFNLLEMVSPGVSPEMGVGIYENDRTQGPACAIACGAATIYRNYFADVDGQVGQSEEKQIDCLKDMGAVLGNDGGSLWDMRNGYALATEYGLERISETIAQSSEEGIDQLRSHLRIGTQWDAGVTLGNSGNVVSQAFCSALPVAYSQIYADSWEPFARLVLEASYEATFHAALLNQQNTGSPELFLTLLGGGAFGNRMDWIVDAIERALNLMKESGIKVKIVSYHSPTPEIQGLLTG